MGAFEITALTVPERKRQTGRDFEYPRIVGFIDPDRGTAESLAEIPHWLTELPTEEKPLALSHELGRRFLETLRAMTRTRHPGFTCHNFARALTGAPTPFDPIFHDFRPGELTLASDMRLAMGAVGVVGSSLGLRPFHSLIGLGEDATESLQVLSAGGELTVVDTVKVVESYARACPTTDLYLYESRTAATA